MTDYGPPGDSDAYKKISAKPQIFGSNAGERNLFTLNGSGSASARSRFSRRIMNAHSLSLRKPQVLWPLSGKSTTKIRHSKPTMNVNWQYVSATPCHQGGKIRTEAHHSLHDKDPSPCGMALDPLHLTESVCQYTGERAGHAADDVEQGIPFLDLIYQEGVSAYDAPGEWQDRFSHREYQQERR